MSISFQSSKSETMFLYRWECGRLCGHLATVKTTQAESAEEVVKAYRERSRSVRHVKVAVILDASLGCLIQGRSPELTMKVIDEDGDRDLSPSASNLPLSKIVQNFGESYPVEHRKDRELKGVILEAMAKLEWGHPIDMGAKSREMREGEYDRMKDHCGVGVRAPVEMSDLGLEIEMEEAGWKMTYLPVAHGAYVLEDDRGVVRAWEVGPGQALLEGVGALRMDLEKIAAMMEARDRKMGLVKV